MQRYFVSFSVIIVFFIVGCGYKPAINYATKSLNGSIYTSLDFGKNDGRDSAYLKESINKILLRRFHVNIVNKKKLASNILNVKIDDISQKALQIDSNGYVKIYKLIIRTTITYFKNTKEPKIKRLHLSNYSTYIVDDDSTITADNKQIAIQDSIDRILQTFVSTIAIDNI